MNDFLDWLDAAKLGIIVTGAVAITNTVVQGRRQHRLWIMDERADAYAALDTASRELASATLTRAAVIAKGRGMPIDLHERALHEWLEAHKAFAAAQSRAALLGGREVADHVERMSAIASEMIDAMNRAAPPVDEATWTVGDQGDPEALAQVTELGSKAIELHDEFLRVARRELGTAHKRRRGAR
jgi:hypothetical protein